MFLIVKFITGFKKLKTVFGLFMNWSVGEGSQLTQIIYDN